MEEKSQSLTHYKPDINFLYVLKDFLTADIESSDENVTFPPEGKFSKLKDGKDVRTVYPQGICVLRELLEQKPTMYFVGFIGFKRPTSEMGESLVQRIWQLDGEIMKALKDYPDILAYVTGERENGNWGNLVVLRSLDVIEVWRDSALHTSAMMEISPKYYHTVRIHRGQINSGFHGELNVIRTLFLDYDNEGLKRREIKMWN